MGHKNKLSLIGQVEHTLTGKLRIGQSKYQAKKAGTSGDGIYSYGTLKTYLKQCCAFVKWCKAAGYRVKTLEDCRPYAAEWVTSGNVSAYTEKLRASALAKLYGCQGAEICQTRRRKRSEIIRSRGSAGMDRHFSEDRNRELVEFCRSTGLRRSELAALKGSDFTLDVSGRPVIHVRNGKGGRERYAPICGDYELVRALCQAAGDGHVFHRIHAAADIHSYRAEYATAIYLQYARPLEECKAAGAVYWCRGDRRGQWFDKDAMRKASEALGHSRISVIGEHYLRL